MRCLAFATRVLFYHWLPFLALCWLLEFLALHGLLERFMGQTLQLLP